jgi:cell division protein FtsQ
MTSQTKKSRAETVRQRRSSIANSSGASRTSSPVNRRTSSKNIRQSYRPETIFLPVEPQTRRTLRQAQESTVHLYSGSKASRGNTRSRLAVLPKSGKKDSHRNSYDFAFSLGRASVHTPAMNLPRLGPRWISAVLTVVLTILVYTMWTANTFRVSAAQVVGNQRLDAADVQAVLGVIGQPIFVVMPGQIENNLRVAFPDLAGVSVHIGFPNKVFVDVSERTPLIAWYQDNKTTWIDSSGIAFMPRGTVQGLVQVASEGNPPKISDDFSKSIYDQPFLTPDTVKAIISLSSQVPEGAPMIYDPKYGMGWQDPRGWSVFFGQSPKDIQMKLKVYQSILDTITQQGIQPTLISVEYLDAPFYK